MKMIKKTRENRQETLILKSFNSIKKVGGGSGCYSVCPQKPDLGTFLLCAFTFIIRIDQRYDTAYTLIAAEM